MRCCGELSAIVKILKQKVTTRTHTVEIVLFFSHFVVVHSLTSSILAGDSPENRTPYRVYSKFDIYHFGPTHLTPAS